MKELEEMKQNVANMSLLICVIKTRAGSQNL